MAYTILFSKIYDFVFFPILKPIRKKVACEVTAIQPRNLIDLCCGTGNQIKYLKNLPDANIVGIDISDNMLACARKNKVEKFCHKQNATNTNFANESFDIALLNFILHETSPEIAIKISNEAKRIVRKSGKIIITDYVFDKKTNFIGKLGAFIVERIIGGTHYRNFTYYIQNQMLKKYTVSLQKANEYNFLFGAVRVQIYNNLKDN